MSIDSKSLFAGIKKYPVVAVSGLISLVLLLALYFRGGKIDEQQIELARVSAESERYRSNISNAAQLQEQLAFLIQANDAVKNRAMDIEGLAQNLQYFYRLELETGVKYSDLRPAAKPPVRGAATKGPAPVYVPLNYIVNVQGDFPQIILFLRRLEQGVYFCRVNSAVASNTGTGLTLNLNLDLLGIP